MSTVVLGAHGHIGAPDRQLSLPEFIFQGVTGALTDAGCTMGDIDGIVLAAHDIVDGRSLSSMITGPAAGAYLRDEIRVSDDGLVALSLGDAKVAAGEGQRVLVAAWGRNSEGGPAHAERASFDPFVERPFGLDRSVASALRASARLRRPSAHRRADAASARLRRAGNTGLAAIPPVAPLRQEEMPVPADAVAAVVLGSDGSGPRIVGIGHGTESARLGDRDLAGLPAARSAVTEALGRAGVSTLDIDLLELGGHTLVDEVLLLEATGVAAAGDGFATYADSEWVNPSGGGAAGDCYPASGLLRFVAAVDQLRGRAAERQLTTGPRRGLVVADSAVAMQTCTAAIVEAS